MIGTWLDLPVAGIFAVLVALYGATGALIVWLAYGTPFRGAVHRLDGVVSTFIGAIAILFALLTGFLASDIGDRNRQAARAVLAEAGELHNVFTLSVAASSDMREIRAAWAGYVQAIVADDWPAMEHGLPGAATGIAYDLLLREVGDPRIATEAGAAVHTALLNAAVRSGTARSDRLALAGDRTNELKWAVVLILGVMTQIAIGLVHLQRRNAHIAAMVAFSTAAVIALGLIALQERPFTGEVRLAPTALQELLKVASADVRP